MLLNIHEILEETDKLEGKEAKIAYLQKNSSQALKLVLQCFFHPDVHFYTTVIPAGYKPNDSPIGMGYVNLHSEWKQLRYFIANRPEAANIKPAKLDRLLLQFLETLEAKEAEVIIHMMKKDFKPYGLRKTVVKEAFPDLGL